MIIEVCKEFSLFNLYIYIYVFFSLLVCSDLYLDEIFKGCIISEQLWVFGCMSVLALSSYDPINPVFIKRNPVTI